MAYELQRNSTASVGTSSVMIAQSVFPPAKRKAIVITNTGATNITIAFDETAIAGSGIVLYPTGAWAESEDSKFDPTQTAVYAIGSAVGGSVAIHERVVS